MTQEIVAPLLNWYGEHKRELPWRDQNNPYYTWVSEIMLQQTRVEAVKAYFIRFVGALPDIASLAACPEDRLLKLWEGLGYYSRVRNLKAAARQVMETYQGQLPSRFEDLRSLKGIGDYTAGAIASIAFSQPVPAVDGNVLRVMARLREDPRDLASGQMKKEVTRKLAQVIPQAAPGDFNQALMELGALVCLPNGEPLCVKCPLAFLCQAWIHGATSRYPVPKPKKERTIQNRTILVIQDGDHTAICKRPSKGLLAGLYEPVNLSGHLGREDALAWAKEEGLDPLFIETLPESTHIFTHMEWHMIAYRIRVAALAETFPQGGDRKFFFCGKEEVGEAYAIPSAYKRYLLYLKGSWL